MSRCGNRQPHPPHEEMFEPSHSPIPIPWHCDGVTAPPCPLGLSDCDLCAEHSGGIDLHYVGDEPGPCFICSGRS